jgi:hypothetical protein
MQSLNQLSPCTTIRTTGGLKDTRAVGATGLGSERAGSGGPSSGIVPGVTTASGSPATLKAMSVGILPMGTSNDFAATTGIPQVRVLR